MIADYTYKIKQYNKNAKIIWMSCIVCHKRYKHRPCQLTFNQLVCPYSPRTGPSSRLWQSSRYKLELPAKAKRVAHPAQYSVQTCLQNSCYCTEVHQTFITHRKVTGNGNTCSIAVDGRNARVTCVMQRTSVHISDHSLLPRAHTPLQL